MNEKSVKIIKVVVSKVIDVVVKNDVNNEISEKDLDESFIDNNNDLACFYENVIAGNSFDAGDGNVYIEPFDDRESLIQNIHVYEIDREWFEKKEVINELNVDGPICMKCFWENRIRKLVKKSGFFDDEEKQAA